MSEPHAGFWGPVTSTLDWCESNYLITFYVAEFFNTLSSSMIVLAGVVGWWLHRHLLEKRYLFAFATVAWVGIGSVAFHASLRFELQLLDELPMVYTVSMLTYVLLERQRSPRYGSWLPWLLLAYAAGVTLGELLLPGDAKALFFLVSFTALEFFCLFLCFRLYRASQQPAERRLFRRGMAMYLIGIAFWTLDVQLCEQLRAGFASVGLPYLQFHAFWHVFVAAGFYLLVLMMAHARLVTLGHQVELSRYGLGLREQAERAG